MVMNMSIVHDHDERCYPDTSPKRGREDHLARYAFFAPYVKGKTVADVGCGEGYGADMLRTAGANKVIALDADRAIIDHAKAKYPEVSYLVADATNTGLPPSSVDIAISFEVWHHLDRYEAFIPEMFRILKPGGLLVCSVPNKHIIYLNPFHLRMLTPFYRKDFDRSTIEHYLSGHFVVVEWFGQRFIRPLFANPLMRIAFWALSHLSHAFLDRANHIYKLANGPAVLPLEDKNARTFVVVAKKI